MAANPEDFTIHVEGKTIVCNKTILQEGSEYFRAMFDSKMIESKANEATLQEQIYGIVKCLIDSLKTGELEICNNVEELLEGAMILQIEPAIKTCTAYLEKTLDSSNCLSLLKVAETFALDSLYNLAKRHALYYFNDVVKYEEFRNLTQNDLINYLSEKHLNVESELYVLDAVYSWVNSNSANEKTVSAILECFHPEDLMEGEWEQAIKKPIFTETVAGKQWLESNSKPSSTTGDQYRELPVMFLTVGGIKPGVECLTLNEAIPDICRFDFKEKCFKPYRSIHDIYSQIGDKMGYSVCTFGRYMYISGGQADLLRQSYETRVWRFDSFTEKWTHLADMPACRRHHGTCASEGSYYMIGGFGKYRKCLSSFEEYDIEQGVWSDLPCLPHPLFSMEVTKTREKLLAFKDNCFCFDFISKTWTEIKCIDERIRYPVCYNNNIYLFPKDEWPYIRAPEEPEELKLKKIVRKRLGQKEPFETVSVGDKFNINSTNVIAVGKKFFYIQRMTSYYEEHCLQLISGMFEDFCKVSEVSDSYYSFTQFPKLVALHSYPKFKSEFNSLQKVRT